MTLSESIRLAKGKMTLKELSKLSGYSVSYLSDLQRGHTQPSLKALGRVCEALGVRVCEVMERVEETT